eukprot:GHUV01035738.1.p1 GENE.GHUV01035738.1~~GHUV01035738.1.p1  ORF type:complete len:686 (+),score=191.39 GHUV01035738.1:330-2387(+)
MERAWQLERRGSAKGAAPGTLSVTDDDDLDRLSKPILTRRKDFIDKEEEARKSPNRVLYFRRNADYDRLIEVCSRKLAENPRNVRALLIRASSNLKKGALEPSLADYKAVLQLEPRNVDALYYRGTVYEKLGRLDEAISDFTAVLTLDPNHIKASYARGACRNLKGDFASAIDDYTYALERDRKPPKSRNRSRGGRSGSLREGLLSRNTLHTGNTDGTVSGLSSLSLSNCNSLTSSDIGSLQLHGNEDDYGNKSSSNSPTCGSPRANSFRVYDPQMSGSIQGNTVSPPSLSAPTSARGLSQGDTGGGFSRNSSYGSFTMQQRQHGASSSEGSGAQPLEYGSPPHVSRSGSWVTLANGGGSVNSSFTKEAMGSAVSGVASILSRPPSALAGSPQAQGNGGSSFTTSISSSAVEADPQKRAKLADYYHARGYAARKQGNFKGAVDEYTRALSLSPTHFKALFNRGFSYDKLGQYDKAIADYTRALEVDPANSFAYYNRGITKDRMGDFGGAVADFSSAIALDPKNADFYHNRGFSLRKQGRFEAAIKDYTMAIALNPGHCRAYYNRAFSHDRLGQYEEAVADYSRALQIEPSNATALHNRGSLFERLGRLQDALQDFSAAIATDPSAALSFSSRALLLERLGQPEAALADHNAAVTLDPMDPGYVKARGLCYRTLGQYEAAAQDFSK